MIISSKQNQYVKMLKALQTKKGRDEEHLAIVEGKKFVAEALKAGIVKQIFVSQEFEDPPKDAVVFSRELFKHISQEQTPQGILAVIKTDGFTFKKPNKNFLVLDRVQDPNNLGAIIRSAAAFDFLEIFLIDCCDVFNFKTIKASAGNVFKCKFSQIKNIDAFSGFELFVGDFGGEDLESVKAPKQPFGIVVGNEGSGVSEQVLKQCTKVVTIKMQNDVESLNVAVAASILMNKLSKKEK